MPGDTVVIRLPGPRAPPCTRALRALRRRAALPNPATRCQAEAPARRQTVAACGAVAAQAELLLRDLRREGLLAPGARTVALDSDGDCVASAPKQDQDSVLRPVSLRQLLMLGDSSVDILLDFGYFDYDGDRFAFADRVLKHGGIRASPINSSSVFRLPHNYCVIYIRQFAEIFVGVKKIGPAGDNGNAGTRMDLSSLASLKKGVVSSELPETTSLELKNMGRKLLLPDISVTPAARESRGSLQMLNQDQIQSSLSRFMKYGEGAICSGLLACNISFQPSRSAEQAAAPQQDRSLVETRWELAIPSDEASTLSIASLEAHC